jgi:serine protease Do
VRVHVVSRSQLIAAAAGGSLLLAACGGAGPGNQAQPSEQPAERPSSSSAGAGALADVEAATIQIIAEGTFVDPQEGEQANSAGAGSGFIVDPEGIAVTNNHVVTGAAFLQVYVGGSDEPVNARVLGVSECSDLAVIDLEGEGYTSLEWASGAPTVGQDAYAAGFPLGDPEYTLTRGIISKAEADGETGWASVDQVLEHDATINPGNSGGPLVDSKGAVLGVNYAGNNETRQQFAIGAAEAQGVIESLRKGNDVTSLGINGQAIATDDGSGIWVASVESGSPADRAGVKGGDFITRLENVNIATDGTMSQYCDILRSHAATDVLSIEVLRTGTGETLEGQVNGTPLTVVTSFQQALPGGEEVQEGAAYSEYVRITDETGAVSVEVPAEWADIDGAPYTPEDGIYRVDVRASTDLAAFRDGWDVPGVVFTASSGLAGVTTVDGLLDSMARTSARCAPAGTASRTRTALHRVLRVYSAAENRRRLHDRGGGAGDGSYLASVQLQSSPTRTWRRSTESSRPSSSPARCDWRRVKAQTDRAAGPPPHRDHAGPRRQISCAYRCT